jgi:hypothetical protein
MDAIAAPAHQLHPAQVAAQAQQLSSRSAPAAPAPSSSATATAPAAPHSADGRDPPRPAGRLPAPAQGRDERHVQPGSRNGVRIDGRGHQRGEPGSAAGTGSESESLMSPWPRKGLLVLTVRKMGARSAGMGLRLASGQVVVTSLPPLPSAVAPHYPRPGPAEVAGVAVGDALLEVCGVKVGTGQDALRKAVGLLSAADCVTLVLHRDSGDAQECSVYA